jgi:hypothetical protein
LTHKTYLQIQAEIKHSSSTKRRSLVVENMNQLIGQEKDCFKCKGHCCTFEFNSMQVTPLESFDVYDYLLNKNMITPELISRLEDNIKHFRLDKDFLSLGKKSFRRYYTCPFYLEDKLGCSIGKNHKPYGCLAFNPKEMNVTTPGHCTSYTDSLELREEENRQDEDVLNESLKKTLSLYWDKKDISTSVLYLIKLFHK